MLYRSILIESRLRKMVIIIASPTAASAAATVSTRKTMTWPSIRFSARENAISAMLAAMTHIPPVVWEYQCSIAYVLHMLDVIVRQNSAEGKSTKHDESVKAIRNLGMAAWNIKVRWEKEHGHGQ